MLAKVMLTEETIGRGHEGEKSFSITSINEKISRSIPVNNFCEATGFNDDIKEMLVEQLKKTSNSYRKNFIETLKEIQVVNVDKRSFYRHDQKSLNIDLKKRVKACSFYENPLHVFFHEMGHAIDYNRCDTTRFTFSDVFKEAFRKDISLLIQKLSDENEVIKMQKIRNDHESRGIQDIFSSLPYLNKKGEFKGKLNNENVNKLKPNYVHEESYWTRRNDPAIDARSELFAHISAAQASKKQQEYMRQYFPNSFKAFSELLH